MTLAELLPLVWDLDLTDRRTLAEELWLPLGDEPVDSEVLRLVEQRVAIIHENPERCVDWVDFALSMADS